MYAHVFAAKAHSCTEGSSFYEVRRSHRIGGTQVPDEVQYPASARRRRAVSELEPYPELRLWQCNITKASGKQCGRGTFCSFGGRRPVAHPPCGSRTID